MNDNDCASKAYMLNAFYPNDDGINDSIYPLGDQLEILDFKIYASWGNLIHNKTSPWNGKIDSKVAAPGVYVYAARIKNMRLGFDEIIKGEFTLIK